jgi:hypothetical protein
MATNTYRLRGYRVKLHNRRIFGSRLKDGTYHWEFWSLLPNRKIRKHKVHLSREAVVAMIDIMAALDGGTAA